MSRTQEAELTVMVMVTRGDAVVVQERRGRGWDGLIFPGGHVEQGESFTAAARREVMEETGLEVGELTFCGVVDWAHRERNLRYLAFLFRGEGRGELLPETREGRNFWMPLEEYRAAPEKSPGMDAYLACFTGEAAELFAKYDSGSTDELVRQSSSGAGIVERKKFCKKRKIIPSEDFSGDDI